MNLVKTTRFVNYVTRYMIGTGCCLAVVSVMHNTANAQLFGSRTVGSPLGNRSANAPLGTAGQNVDILSGTERFLRGNRSRRDFVGSDRSEASGFVGSTQAIGVGRVPSATEGLKIETTDANRINRPLPKLPTKGMYYPRLELDLIRNASESELEDDFQLNSQLQSRVERIGGSAVTIGVQDRVAVMRGTVRSQNAAELLSNILSFEPGIDEVRNELTIANP